MITALASGAFLGLSCGLAPGPLLALLLAQTLRHGPHEGCKIALTPLVSDAPIIAEALVVAAKLAQLRPLLGVVSLAGAAFVLYLAWDSFRPLGPGAEAPPKPPRSWFKGIFTNLLSPHPWLFWLTVGAAILAKAIAESWLVGVHALEGERRRPIYNDNHNSQNWRDNSGMGQLLRNIPARFFLSFPVSAADSH